MAVVSRALLALAAALMLLAVAVQAASPVASRLQAAAGAGEALPDAIDALESELDPSAGLTLPLALDAQVEVQPSFNASEDTEMAPPPAHMLRAADDVVASDAEGEAKFSGMLGAVSVCAQRGGTCQSTSLGCAGGSYSSGLCPGAANIKCCLVASSACSARGGSCRHTSVGCPGGSFSSGLCPGDAEIKCCLSSGGGSGGSCGVYSGASVLRIVGNNNQVFGVVRIAREHLSNPSIAGADPTTQDNTMTQPTACAFQAMYNAAQRAGIKLTINSGFRTLARQQYFWNCYVTKKCNNGNLAARPGTSNHGIGLALDLNTGGGAYNWLKNNAHSFGFIRTVPSETWHWEYRPGQPPAPYT